MAIGERIHFFRKSAGHDAEISWHARWASRRSPLMCALLNMRTGSRTPKADLTAALAQIFWMFRLMALAVPDIDSYAWSDAHAVYAGGSLRPESLRV